MRCRFLLGCVAVAATFVFGSQSPASADPPDILRDYQFIPSQSTVTETGALALDALIVLRS